MATLTEREQHAIDNGFAYLWNGRVIPIIRGGDETPEEKAARETAEAAAAEAAKDKTFTQADVDRIVQERVARVKTDPPADYDDLKSKAAEFDKLQEANKSDLEKERTARETAERERDEARTAAKETRLNSAILAEASKADRKVVDPEAVLQLLDRSKLEIDDAGNPTNIAEAMDSLLAEKKYLAGGGAHVTDVDQGARGNKEQLQSTEGMSADEIAAAVADGRLDSYLKTPA